MSILTQILQKLKDSHPSIKQFGRINSLSDLKKLPITNYPDWDEAIINQKNKTSDALCSNLVRYQPTSGSTSTIKWIPYNQQLLNDFNQAANTWLYELYRQFPAINTGKHYWSLSWIPNEHRESLYTDDTEIFSPVRRFLFNKVFAVPKSVSQTNTIEESLIQTATYLLICDDLSFISVWSPTFLITLLDCYINNKKEILDFLPLITKKVDHFTIMLNLITTRHDVAKLWPKLALISCWDTSLSKRFADQLKSYFPNTPMQGKGLWATEAVVTIPYQDDFYLAYHSHFYEFLDLTTKQIKDSWELKVGDIVSPIITTPNGLLRYQLNDKLLVSKTNGTCPAFLFQGRIKDIDMVGEKISQDYASQIIHNLKKFKALTIIAIQSPTKNEKPYYLLLCDCYNSNLLQEKFEELLQEQFHYKLARELGQLSSAQVLTNSMPYHLYENICMQKGMIKGNIKIDPLILSTDDKFRYE